jgi:hypothetical protein
MADPAVIQQRIDEIDAILAGGVKSTRYADRAMERDLDALRQERTHLTQSLAALSGRSSFRRVVFKNG